MKRFFLILLLAIGAEVTSAAELKFADIKGATIDRNAPTRDVVKDYKMVSDRKKDQSARLQFAIDDVSKRGGGNLTIPAGDYCFAEVYMRSNVQLLISSKATLYPYYTARTHNVIMLHFTPSLQERPNEFVENCSVSCLDEGKQYRVDYSDFAPDSDGNQGLDKVRFALARLARDFTIADANILDHYTKFCGIIFVGAKTPDVVGTWEVARPTNGVIRNNSITDASHGYGLCQLHAAENLLFENLRAKGGVTLRLEAHAGANVGIYDIYGRNIYNEYGKAALMMNPHIVHQGRFTVENVETKSSAFAVLIRPGFINKDARANHPDAEIGSYASGSQINKIHSTFGTQAQTESKDVWLYEPDMYRYIKMVEKDPRYSQIEAASYTTVLDNTEGSYSVICTNITHDGYPHHVDGVLHTETLPRTQKSTWGIVKQIPAYSNK